MKKLLLGLLLILGASAVLLLTLTKEKLVVPLSATITEVPLKGATYNIALRLEEKIAIGEFHSKWINYRTNTSEEWADINTTLTQTVNGFVMDKAPFEFTAPLRSTGTALFHNNNRWDIFDKKDISAPPLNMTIQALGIADVPGVIEYGNLGWGQDNYVIYKNAYSDIGADSIYYVHQGAEPNLKKLIRFPANPNLTADFKPSFIQTYSEDVDFIRPVNGVKTKWLKQAGMKTTGKVEAKVKSTNEKRGIGMRDFWVWDSGLGKNQKSQRIDVEFYPTGNPNEYSVMKIIPASFFAQSLTYPVFSDITYDFYPDSNGVPAVDGQVRYVNGASWAAAHDAADGITAAPSTLSNTIVATTYTDAGQKTDIGRGFTLFDTSAIGSDSDITSATMSIYFTAKTNTDNDGKDYIGVYTTTPASNTDLVVADYDQIGTALQATELDITGLSINVYTDWTIDATGTPNISKTGVTKFGLRTGHDAENSPITLEGVDSMTATWSETAGDTTDPKLTVQFASSTPAAAAGILTKPLWRVF